jgi:RNA polymerase sigma factor (sigma-70 family)
MIALSTHDVEAARRGDRAALAAVIRSSQRPIFNLAMRMLANTQDAEDATQEVLVQIITHLGALRDIDAAGGWAWKVACRHLERERKRGRVEAMRLTFECFATDLETGVADIQDHGLTPIEEALAVEEVKVSCTLAMLTCLSRPVRIAYILGEIFEMSDTEAADALDVAPAAYRQRLRRARESITAFTLRHCGLAEDTAKCRCERRVGTALSCGRIRKGTADFGLDRSPRSPDVKTVRAHVQSLESGRRTAAILRGNPDFATNVGALVLATIEDDQHADIRKRQ